MRILVKESKPNQSEYLIYLLNFDGYPVTCQIVNNEKEKNNIIKEMQYKNSYLDKTTIDYMNYDEFITQDNKN